jgi:hypothetical protein
MNWTTVRPAHEGWYGYRKSPLYAPMMVKLQRIRGCLSVAGQGCRFNLDRFTGATGEWTDRSYEFPEFDKGW